MSWRSRQVSTACAAWVASRIGAHHITSRSASIAPAAFMACKTATRSRADTPSRLNALTSFLDRAGGRQCHGRLGRLLSIQSRDLPPTPSLPCLENGPGWEAQGVCRTDMERPPWATATGGCARLVPATTVPVRSLTTIARPLIQDPTSKASSCDSMATTRPFQDSGTLICTNAGSLALAPLHRETCSPPRRCAGLW